MKRAIGLLVVSLFAGVLVAQDGSTSLRDHVRALRTEIERATPHANPNAVTERYYDVGGLLAVPRTSIDERREVQASRGDLPPIPDEPSAGSTWSSETLLEFVTEAAGPDSNVDLQSGRLRVAGPPAVHKRIERLLGWLAKRTRERLIVEIEIVPALDGDDVAWARDQELSPRKPLGRAVVHCTNGADQAFSALQKRRYIFDYDEESAREAGIAKARTALLSEGLSGDVQMRLDRWAGGVLAHLRVNWQRLSAEPRSADTQHGSVTLPTLDAVRLSTSAWLPLDRPVLLATCTRGMTPCHVIVRVRAAG